MKIKELAETIRKADGKYLFIGLVLFLLAGWFYWFQWRPTRIRAQCYKLAEEYIEPIHQRMAGKEGGVTFEKFQQLQEARESKFSNCLHSHGLRE